MHTVKCMKSSERFGERLSICVNIIAFYLVLAFSSVYVSPDIDYHM